MEEKILAILVDIQADVKILKQDQQDMKQDIKKIQEEQVGMKQDIKKIQEEQVVIKEEQADRKINKNNRITSQKK